MSRAAPAWALGERAAAGGARRRGTIAALLLRAAASGPGELGTVCEGAHTCTTARAPPRASAAEARQQRHAHSLPLTGGAACCRARPSRRASRGPRAADHPQPPFSAHRP
jgi:hypothetical protein